MEVIFRVIGRSIRHFILIKCWRTAEISLVNVRKYVTVVGKVSYTIHAGTKELPKPFFIKVRSIVDALTPRYWQTLKEFISSGVCQKGQAEDDILKKKRAILTKALEKYPAYLGAVSPKGRWYFQAVKV